MRPAPLGILFCFVSCVVLCLASHASADSQHVVIRDDLAPFPKELMARVDATRAALANPPDAKELITKAKEQFSLTDLKPEAKDFYCIIHLLRWSDPATDNR